jgi:4'-phosphopantetheinyl transferase
MMADSGRSLVLHCTGPETLMPGAVNPLLAPAPGLAHLWFATLDALRPRLAELEALLDPVEQERAQRFRFDHDRTRFVLGHGWLRELLGQYLQRDAGLIRLARGPYGKPYLERKALRFNFSDTKDAIAIAFATELEVGVDVETIARAVDHQAVSGHYFTDAETEAIAAAGEHAKRRFLEFWTRKEAVLKASGVGIMEDLRALRVDRPRNAVLIAHEVFQQMAAPEYHVRTYHIGEGHIVSLASPQEVAEVRLWGV